MRSSERLIDTLRGGATGSLARADARASLRQPWCWPADAALRAAAMELGVEPTAPQPGEALLVSVSPRHDGASLWRLTPRVPGAPPHDVPFVGEARLSLQRAWGHALRSIEALRTTRPLRADAWCAALIVRDQQRTAERVLDGGSFGVSMCLATASLLMHEPVPASLAASCAVDSSGRASPVEGLATKVALIAREALGVTRLLVHATQVDEARRAAAQHRADLEVVGVHRVAEAVTAAFPDLPARMSAWWPQLDDARAAADELFRCVVEDRATLLDWAPLAAAAERLEQVLRDEPDARRRASYARAIARRHGNHNEPLAWPDETWLRSLRRPLRQRMVAQLVQSATDAAAPDLGATLDRALHTLPPEGDEHAEDLAVLGACGRALAGLERYDDALRALQRAVAAWLELGRAPEASHALCELLRVDGILARDDATARARLQARLAATVLQILGDADLPRSSAAFVQAASERALTVASLAADALDFERTAALDPLDWDADVPRYLAASRQRWRARALAAVGHTTAAAEARAHVEALCAGADALRDFTLLTRLDAALEQSAPVAALLAELRNSSAVSQLRVEGLPDELVARRYADCCRY